MTTLYDDTLGTPHTHFLAIPTKYTHSTYTHIHTHTYIHTHSHTHIHTHADGCVFNQRLLHETLRGRRKTAFFGTSVYLNLPRFIDADLNVCLCAIVAYIHTHTHCAPLSYNYTRD